MEEADSPTASTSSNSFLPAPGRVRRSDAGNGQSSAPCFHRGMHDVFQAPMLLIPNGLSSCRSDVKQIKSSGILTPLSLRTSD